MDQRGKHDHRQAEHPKTSNTTTPAKLPLKEQDEANEGDLRNTSQAAGEQEAESLDFGMTMPVPERRRLRP
jgi:hypothetical protein